MPGTVEKVTAFIIRPLREGYELLLIQHPNAGIQFPAGTVEDGETPEAAALREAGEETGLNSLVIRSYLGPAVDPLPEGQKIISQATRVYSRPDASGFDWAHFRKGIPVTLVRRAGGFTQVAYEEFDRLPDPQYVTLSITGWVPDEALADSRLRHFFVLEASDSTSQRWTVRTDYHLFTLFWAPAAALPKIITPQDQWLEYLYRYFLHLG